MGVNIHPKLPLKRYICSFCARTFSRSEHKLRHERSHTKEKPFDCKICSSAFVRRDLLQRHCRTVHGVVLKTNNQQQSLTNNSGENNASSNRGDSNENNTEHHDPQSSEGESPKLSEPKTSPQEKPVEILVEEKVNPELPPSKPQFSQSNSLNEKNIISLLTLCKKFNYLTIPYELDNSICNYFLTYGTRCHNILPLIKFDRILNLTENDESLFIILCIGANENNDLLDAIKLFNRSWSIINDKISNHKVDYNSENIDEFVENVIMLSYIYLNYFDNNFDQDLLNQNISVDIDVLFDYLNSVIITQILNEGRQPNGGISYSVEELTEKVFPVKLNYWYAQILLLQYYFIYNKQPSILHSFLLNKYLPIEDGVDHHCTLSGLLKNLTTNSSSGTYLPGEAPGSKLFKKLGLIDNILIYSLLNELLIMKHRSENSRQPSYTTAISTFFGDNKNFLHNSIILANKSFNQGNDDQESVSQQLLQQQLKLDDLSTLVHHNQYNINLPIGLLNDGVDNLTVFSRNTHLGNWTVSNKSINNLSYIQFLNMLILCKRKMLISCPLKFIDLITNYVFLPKDQSNWVLLSLTLKEFNVETLSSKLDPSMGFSSEEFQLRNFIDLSNLSKQELTIDKISANVNAYITRLYPWSFVINNNLGIALLPVLYLTLNNVNNTLVNFKNFLSLPSNKNLSVGFIVESFLTMIKILVNYRYRLFNLHSPRSPVTASSTGSYNSNDMLITSPEGFLENSILSVILYVMDQCGSNVLSKLIIKRDSIVDATRPRSNSISIGEFNHNSERLKASLLDKFDEDPKSNPEYPPLVKILSNDFKYYYYLKNLENGLINWLNVFMIDPALLAVDNLDHLMRYKNFIAGFKKSLSDIYAQLDLSHEPNPITAKVSSPQMRPRTTGSSFPEFDLQQQQLQQQSFTGLMRQPGNLSSVSGAGMMAMQQKLHHQQLNSLGFRTNAQSAANGLGEKHHRIILPPIGPLQQQQQQQALGEDKLFGVAEKETQYPSPRPSISSSHFGTGMK